MVGENLAQLLELGGIVLEGRFLREEEQLGVAAETPFLSLL